MKKSLALFFTLFVFCFCAKEQEKIEKFMEDGVEVIVNHLEPYKVKGEPSMLHLEEEFTIDTERDEIAESGLTDIWGFDVSSEGDIFFFKNPRSNGDLILKFDRKGNFATSFAPKGQGPGEIQFPFYQRLTHDDRIPILDVSRKKRMIFDKSGNFVEETSTDFIISYQGMVTPLENGNYLIRRTGPDSRGRMQIVLGLFDSEFKEIKELDSFEINDPMAVSKIRLPLHVSAWSVSSESIFVGNEVRGYEVWVYDFDGNLKRKIEKEYNPEEISEEFKSKYFNLLGDVPDEFLKKIHFPDHLPPFQYFFTDDEGRLFVMTYETEERPDEYMFDIFNPDGLFIGRKSLKLYLSLIPYYAPGNSIDFWTVMRKNRFYCIREKESGFKELAVYKVSWE